MTRRKSPSHTLASHFLWGTLTLLTAIRFLDNSIARAVMNGLQSHDLLQRVTSRIPDMLFSLVCIGTTILWFLYFILVQSGKATRLRQFLLLSAVAVPAAYLLKALLQFSFGRTGTRIWLATGDPVQFHWFHGAGLGSFPSGHMTTFTALGAAICSVYPRLRTPVAGGLTLLGLALIATDHHYLSDVIAGAYTGLLVVLATKRLLVRTDREASAPRQAPSLP
jgi:membrane-associated phospholipid phosphatase